MEPQEIDKRVVPYSDYLQEVMRVAALEAELLRLRELLNRHQRELDEAVAYSPEEVCHES